jgi:ribonuclease BN (tRNA processing enzyme)
MLVTFWGTRGSLPTPDSEMARMGGNTSCVEVQGNDGTVLALDAGTGIRRLGRKLTGTQGRIDILLTHLHFDHIQGLGFFAPLFEPGREVHIWGPASATQPLMERMARYLSPPLFPVHLRLVPSNLHLHDLGAEEFHVGRFRVTADFVCHPNPTVGFRIDNGDSVLTYLPDHEPALGTGTLDRPAAWISGHALAAGADLLIHDAQYAESEYPDHVGWGHSSVNQACAFAALAGVGALVPFHHDPSHTDEDVGRIVDAVVRELRPAFPVMPAMEGTTIALEGGTAQLSARPSRPVTTRRG